MARPKVQNWQESSATKDHRSDRTKCARVESPIARGRRGNVCGGVFPLPSRPTNGSEGASRTPPLPIGLKMNFIEFNTLTLCGGQKGIALAVILLFKFSYRPIIIKKIGLIIIEFI